MRRTIRKGAQQTSNGFTYPHAAGENEIHNDTLTLLVEMVVTVLLVSMDLAEAGVSREASTVATHSK